MDPAGVPIETGAEVPGSGAVGQGRRPETPEETAARRAAWAAEWSQISREIKQEHDAKEV
jgi:hypothetical protein